MRANDQIHGSLSEAKEPKRAAFERSACRASLSLRLLPILHLDHVPFGISNILKG